MRPFSTVWGFQAVVSLDSPERGRALAPHQPWPPASTTDLVIAIRFPTSVDAFNALTAQFSQAYGAPKQIIRDNLTLNSAIPSPAVREVWRAGGQSLRLTDPAARPDRLEIDLTQTAPKRDSTPAPPRPVA